MSDQEVEAKFRALAHGVLAPAQTDILLERLWNVEQVKDVGEVIKLVKRS
jgi:hypothetical protein